MRYLVVIDVHSPLGGIYASGDNDGFVRDRDQKHPLIDCVEVETGQPYCLFAKRDMARKGGVQSVYIPHSSVVAVHCYADEGPRPMGFIDEKSP